jgi:CheY-like chemotaxis protein
MIDQPLKRPALRGLRILLVEDHDSTRQALTHLLQRRQHQVAAAATGGEALRLMEGGEFDLLVSDLGLPDIDGCSLMGRLRELRPGLVGIALSGLGMEEDLQRSSAAGFVSHLVKPVAMGKLDDAIAGAMAAAQPGTSPGVR